MTILVVDDEQMILDLAEKVLKRKGYTVLLAESGSDALSIFQQQAADIDIVLLDLALNDIHGIKLLQQMRNRKKSIPCIISSGDSTDSDDIPAELQENTRFLQKPYRSEALIAMISSIRQT